MHQESVPGPTFCSDIESLCSACPRGGRRCVSKVSGTNDERLHATCLSHPHRHEIPYPHPTSRVTAVNFVIGGAPVPAGDDFDWYLIVTETRDLPLVCGNTAVRTCSRNQTARERRRAACAPTRPSRPIELLTTSACAQHATRLDVI